MISTAEFDRQLAEVHVAKRAWSLRLRTISAQLGAARKGHPSEAIESSDALARHSTPNGGVLMTQPRSLSETERRDPHGE